MAQSVRSNLVLGAILDSYAKKIRRDRKYRGGDICNFGKGMSK